MACIGPSTSPWAMISDDGQRHRQPHVQAGRMAIGNVAYTCIGTLDACPGAFMNVGIGDGMCAFGGQGIACSLCSSGRLFDGNRCQDCASSGTSGPILFVVMVVFGGIIVAF